MIFFNVDIRLFENMLKKTFLLRHREIYFQPVFFFKQLKMQGINMSTDFSKITKIISHRAWIRDKF